MLPSNELEIKCSAPDGDGVHSLLCENSPLWTYLLNMLLVEALHVASPGKPQILRHFQRSPQISSTLVCKYI
jgi:hypothetical protein